MITTELLDYIKTELQKGTSISTITSNLTKNGWFREDIQQAINQIQSPPNQQSPIAGAATIKNTSNADNFYPSITITRIENPSRFYAFPVLGGLFKTIILIPVFIEFFAIEFVSFILASINSFIVLFSGKYWQRAFDLNLGLLTLNAKILLFQYGLTDTYPGFSLDVKDNYFINVTYPQTSNRFFAIPILGGLIRIILLIPFFIFLSALKAGSIFAFIIASFPVFFKGYYPESLYELIRDYVRTQFASSVYFLGMSDKYPSFSISMNHKKIKILLIVLSVCLWVFVNILISTLKPKYSTPINKYNYIPQQNNYQQETLPLGRF